MQRLTVADGSDHLPCGVHCAHEIQKALVTAPIVFRIHDSIKYKISQIRAQTWRPAARNHEGIEAIRGDFGDGVCGLDRVSCLAGVPALGFVFVTETKSSSPPKHT